MIVTATTRIRAFTGYAVIPRFSRDEQVQRSLGHSIKDGIAFSAMIGSAESYFGAFAVLLKATSAQIALIASVPPLLAAFAQMLSAWLGRSTGKRKWLIVFGAWLQMVSLIPIAVLPLMFRDYGIAILLGGYIVYLIGPNLGSPQWGSLMGQIVPENRRGRFFALRTRLSSMASFGSLIAAGLILQWFDNAELAYFGFMSIFILAALARGISAWHLMQIHDPGGHVASLGAPWHRDFIRRIRQSRFVRFSMFFACMQFAVAISSPFVVVHLLRNLEFSYLQLMLNSGASVLIQILTLNRWGRLGDLFGNRLILATTGFLIPVLPALWTLSTNFWYLLAVQGISGLIWAGFTLSATNSVFDLTPPERRATFMATHNIVSASAVFLGAMTGGYLATHLPSSLQMFGTQFSWEYGLYGVFMTSCIARFIVALCFLPRLKEVRRVRKMTPRGLIFRVSRIQPLSGLFFDVVGQRPRNDDRE